MRNIVFLAISLIAIFSCNKQSPDFSDSQISFVLSLPCETRATSSSFETGDEVSLYAVEYDGLNSMPLQVGGNWFNNEKLTYDGSVWNSARALYWSNVACDFYAFYPYQASIGTMERYSFSLATDQNSPRSSSELGGYEASDLMYASATNVSRSAGSVNLTFRHIMSKLVVSVNKGEQFEGEIPNNIVAHVYNTVTDCHVNWLEGSVEKDLFGSKKTLTMKKINNSQFEAILVPQYIEKRTPLIELTMDGIAYLLETSISFRPGYTHTIIVTLNTSPDQEQIEISIDPEASPWN